MKILCIDNKDYHPILEGIIPKITEDFLIFGNYKAAEKEIANFQPDIIICARSIGPYSGVDWVRGIKKTCAIPCLILTSNLGSDEKSAFAGEKLNVMSRWSVDESTLPQKITELTKKLRG
ncbi:MAG: hypothetical protein AAB657_01810 [Patescibacteria group bacterium]